MSTGVTPMEIDTGRRPLPRLWVASDSCLFLEDHQAVIDYAKEQLAKAQERQKKSYDQHRKIVNFNISAFVYVRAKLLNKNFETPDCDFSKDPTKNKLLPHWVGPFPIAQRVGHPVRRAAPVLYAEQGHRIYVIATLIKKRRHRRRLQCLVKWADLPESENSWEDAQRISTVSHWQDLPDDFQRRQQRQRQLKRRGL
ncbi:hypothetical protein PC120_g18352 [Phytophthora cactorum]|nr:hypothetical protein PC120_g18352 [Phytophthora cactorum]